MEIFILGTLKVAAVACIAYQNMGIPHGSLLRMFLLLHNLHGISVTTLFLIDVPFLRIVIHLYASYILSYLLPLNCVFTTNAS